MGVQNQAPKKAYAFEIPMDKQLSLEQKIIIQITKDILSYPLHTFCVKHLTFNIKHFFFRRLAACSSDEDPYSIAGSGSSGSSGNGNTRNR